MEPDHPIDFLPLNLTMLAISQKEAFLIQVPLPESLHTVSLGCTSKSAPFPLDKLSILPPSVTKLKLHWHKREVPCPVEPPQLPLNLMDLDVDLWHQRWFESLPRTLTSFESKLIQGLDVHVDDNFEHLPSGLTRLAIDPSNRSDDDSVTFSGSSFSKLSHLTSLRVGYWKFDRSILHVLRRMPKLDWAHLELSPLEVSDMALLPPHARSCSLGTHAITALPEVFLAWPSGSFGKLLIAKDNPTCIAYRAQKNG